MEPKPFVPGPQVIGSIVIDSSGVQWKVLKNISYATAQPREGAYYTKYADAPVIPAIDYGLLISNLTTVVTKLTARVKVLEGEAEHDLDNRDFKKVTELGQTTIRIIR